MNTLASHVAAFKRSQLPASPSPKDIAQALSDYHHMLMAVLTLMVERSDRRPNDPWLDMKINLVTGADRDADDPLCGYGVINGWIQGRGIEALVGHSKYLAELASAEEAASLLPRVEAMMRRLLDQLRKVRRDNGGHLFFFMSPDGTPLACDGMGTPRPTKLTITSPYNATDMFAAKGMYAAACYLHDDAAAAEAKQYLLAVNDAIVKGAYVTDQQQLDPKNPVRPVPGRHSHGPRMIQILAAANLLEHEHSEEAVNLGLSHIEHILAGHVNTGQWPGLLPWDFVEFLDDQAKPYRSEDKVFCDPGHALEFVGLTLKFTTLARHLHAGKPEDLRAFDRIEQACPQILRRNFASGYQPAGHGICKLYDLANRRPINSDMPWWSLPETLRAAAYCTAIARHPAARDEALTVFAQCHNAFVTHYVKPQLHLQAVQTRDAAGNVVNVIPATPDADPGYHTGLSLIDAVRTLRASHWD